MVDYLGTVRLKIDRDKPLSDCVSVEMATERGRIGPEALGNLYLDSVGGEIVFVSRPGRIGISEIV